ncbi:hypothetical protein FBZ93_1057 [Bradyrhizobium macuxiense]|uniref:Uncharacterized protein n=1 Tax=Bradyrhizobium macuxiense TaxID=1755647 RepID=A0A560M0D6_9BRAD|nr:hypothetical protein [Bradyrhizobium macuxiense]TWC00215.1 hypothetical protein FBZ93_1057 [Bradyrhizobium macuxiense]
MSNPESKPGSETTAAADRMPPLSTEEVSQLLMASSLSATRPLVGLLKFLVNEGILDGGKLKSFLAPMLISDGFPPATRAMLDPIWKSLLHQLDDSKGRSSL